MGVTGMARWVNAPTTGLELVSQNIIRNHSGIYRGRWNLSVKSYRSTLSTVQGRPERTMSAVTLGDNAFVVIEDLSAPGQADIEYQSAENIKNGQPPIPLFGPDAPPHYRNTYLTISPPGALDILLTQLRAQWSSVRSGSSSQGQRPQGGGQQLSIEGRVYGIGTDWIVRIGNVILAGGAVKGMFLEAEYLPIPTLHTERGDGTSELLSNLLTAILPNTPDQRVSAVTIGDSAWADMLWDRELEERKAELERQKAQDGDDKMQQSKQDDVFVSGYEGLSDFVKGDWSGLDRDRGVCFLIMGVLRSEGVIL